MIRSFFGKIHACFSTNEERLHIAPNRKRSLTIALSDLKEDQLHVAPVVPDDVMEGHFVVVANKGEETKRFIVELRHLTNPELLALLKRTKEEYGFKQKGVLVIPCHPQELEKILDEPTEESALVCST